MWLFYFPFAGVLAVISQQGAAAVGSLSLSLMTSAGVSWRSSGQQGRAWCPWVVVSRWSAGRPARQQSAGGAGGALSRQGVGLSAALSLADDLGGGVLTVISSRGGRGARGSWCPDGQQVGQLVSSQQGAGGSLSSGSAGGVLHGQQVAGCPDDHQQGRRSVISSRAATLCPWVVVSRWSAGQQLGDHVGGCRLSLAR